MAMSREIYTALEEELANIDKRLGFTKQRRLPHRQYLTYDVGPGTYSQRQKAYAQHRLNEAMDNVYERQFEKALRNPDAKEVDEFRGKSEWRQFKVTQTLERIANEKIRDAMGKGGFRNLKGMGKPLHVERDNPVLDNMQQKLNKMLSNAGFAPEWISLDKEIRKSIEKVKKRLTDSWSKCGPHPMSPEKEKMWEHELKELSEAVKKINKKISTLNLVVPMRSAQRMHVRLELLVARVTRTPPPVKDAGSLTEEKTGIVGTGDSGSEAAQDQPASHTNGDESNPLYSLVSGIVRIFSSWRSKN